jgi:hypothetical protein
MTNKHISQPPTDLLRARLRILLENLDSVYRSSTSVVEEDLVDAYHQAMSTFMQSLDGSITGATASILKGMPADPTHYNIFTNSILRDLEAIYSEVGALDVMVTSSFNSIIAEREQALQISKRVSDKLGTYLLYADPNLGAGYFFGDSFNGTENIEVGSSLLDADECFIGQNEGVILLPLDGNPESPKVKSYIINSNSNGISGNNSEIAAVGHDSIEAIGDSEPNTWYEYEQVMAYESSIPLILDLTIVLEDISIINHIHVNPINFGTPTPIRVAKLETSRDGLEYISIKDEIPLKDFVSEDEENTFSLSPSTSKFSGQGFYSFLPRKAQFVHIVLEQHTPYNIDTVNGTRLRYAIGIRDIEIQGRKFKPEGSLISKPFSAPHEVRKVALFASENPLEASVLADITHSISENDGATWRQIQPQHRSGFLAPEVINYNTIADGSIDTASPVTALRHKIYMKRDTDAFNGNVTLKEEKLSKVDIVDIPVGGDFSISVTDKPIKETVRVILPFYGSYSCPRVRYGSAVQGKPAPMDLDMLEFNVDVSASSSSESTDILRFDLPFIGFEDLHEHIRVFHNGSQIEYCAKDLYAMGAMPGVDSYTSYEEVDSDSKIYFLDRGGRQLQFGYIDSNGTRRGFIPQGGSRIQVCFDGDNPYLELTDQGYVLNLSASSDGFKENVSISTMNYLSEDEAIDHQIELSPGRSKSVVTAPINTRMIQSGKSETPSKFTRVGSRAESSAKAIGDDSIKTNSLADRVVDNNKSSRLQNDITVTESEEGMLPPVFVDDNTSWEIVEYTSVGTIISSGNIFTQKQDFIDGRQELLTWNGSTWVDNPNAYSFDSASGTVYLGSSPNPDRKTMFRCKIVTTTNIPGTGWKYYRHSITGQMDPKKIILNPKYVVTHTKKLSVDLYRSSLSLAADTALKSINLLDTQAKGHSWYKQRLVKGTVKIDSSIFASNVKPTEVPFVDGESELYSIVQIKDEPISLTHTTGNLYTYTLSYIDSNHMLSGQPGFAGVRQIIDPNPPPNYFQTYVSSTPSSHGEWTFTVDSSGICTITVYIASTANENAEHICSYRYKTLNPGIDIDGLYSIDYINGTIHFAEPISGSGYIQYEISLYSAFYNISEVVSDGNIQDIEEDSKKIILSQAFGMRFLKMSTALKARPAYAKVAYDYYKQSSESLKDLEPYFSPICKDIALRAVTSNILEEL